MPYDEEKDIDAKLHQVLREAAEVGLKYISWSIMFEAILYLAEKTGSLGVKISAFAVMGLQVIYLNGHIYRVQQWFFRRYLDFSRHSPRKISAMGLLSVVVSFGLWVGTIVLASNIVSALIKQQLQLP